MKNLQLQFDFYYTNFSRISAASFTQMVQTFSKRFFSLQVRHDIISNVEIMS